MCWTSGRKTCTACCPVQNGFLRRIASAVSDWHYKRADRLIAMSLSLKKRLMERTGKPADRVAVIPQHCEDFYAVPQPDKELAERYAGRFNLVFTGNFSPAQSLDTVIRAAVKARGMGAENLRLLMVGDGMSRNALEALVDELTPGTRWCSPAACRLRMCPATPHWPTGLWLLSAPARIWA